MAAPSPRGSASLGGYSNLREYYDALLAAYGAQNWWPAETQMEVVAGAYLTQNTSWRAVERSIANLKSAQVLQFDSLREIPEEKLRELIRPSGYMTRKAAAIKTFVDYLGREHEGSFARLAALPAEEARRQLLELSGVGEETADAILLYALGHPRIVADEYLRRILSRHGLAAGRPKYGEIQQAAAAAFGGDPLESLPGLMNEFHALVVAVGKRHCGPRPNCCGCPLEGM